MPEKPPKSGAHTSKIRFSPPFWQIPAVALHAFSPIVSSSAHYPGLDGIVKKDWQAIGSKPNGFNISQT